MLPIFRTWISILRVVRLFAAISSLPFLLQMAIFIQLLRRRKTKSSNMLLVCYFSCYRLTR